MNNEQKLSEIFGTLFPRDQAIKSAELFLKSLGMLSVMNNEQKEELSKLNDELYKYQVNEFVKSVGNRFTDNEIDCLSTFYGSVVSAKWSAFNLVLIPKLLSFKFEGGDEIQGKISLFFQSIIEENGLGENGTEFF